MKLRIITVGKPSSAALQQLCEEYIKRLKGQGHVVEFGDPNPFKRMHLGHLYSAIVGDTVANLLEAAGADVRRLSYHGDVGMHVAKAIWQMRRSPEVMKLLERSDEEIAALEAAQDPLVLGIKGAIGDFYAEGHAAFDNDPAAHQEIEEVNRQIYTQDDEIVKRLHALGSRWSFEQFDEVFKRLGVNYSEGKFRYLESETEAIGVKMVREAVPRVFSESDGAIVYKGEKVGLHTRVFITSKGLPTYEAKDLGLAIQKHQDHPRATQSIVITANEQKEYFKVMLAALREINHEAAERTRHLSHGFLSLTSGKMSSRTGNVVDAQDLIEGVEAAVLAQYPETDRANKTPVAAIRYSMLKNRIGNDIIFDVDESVSLEGSSGPYLQYALVRARSILNKSAGRSAVAGEVQAYMGPERSLARKLSEYPDVFGRALTELAPHHVANYLYELAQVFNRFYENCPIINDEREAVRLELVRHYHDVLAGGLGLLGITPPEQM